MGKHHLWHRIDGVNRRATASAADRTMFRMKGELFESYSHTAKVVIRQNGFLGNIESSSVFLI